MCRDRLVLTLGKVVTTMLFNPEHTLPAVRVGRNDSWIPGLNPRMTGGGKGEIRKFSHYSHQGKAAYCCVP